MTMETQPAAAVDEERLERFLGTVVSDLGACVSASLVRIGERLGLYRAMAGAGPLTPGELAERTATAERYVREWLAQQAAGGYVEYDPASRRYTLPPEHAMALADEDSPACMLGGFQTLVALAADEGKVLDAFRTGEGVGWHEHSPDLFEGTERMFGPGYRANLVQSWIPALEGVEARLQAGGRAADIGCGHGASTIIMAAAYPGSRFTGFDYHAASIEAARQAAARAGVSERATFEVASAKELPLPEGGYDLICYFDCLHDMGDPVGALRRALEALAPGGTVMLVEPSAGDHVEDNLNPMGRLGYGMSTMFCTPASLDQEVALGLGAQAGEARLRAVAEEAGFTHFRRAAETPLNFVLEARR